MRRRRSGGAQSRRSECVGVEAAARTSHTPTFCTGDRTVAISCASGNPSSYGPSTTFSRGPRPRSTGASQMALSTCSEYTA